MAGLHPKGDGQFPTTEWTLVARLGNEDATISARALNELCSLYHFPLYCFIRQRGLSHHDAEDALHDFLAKLVRVHAFADLSSDKGRLRTFLAKSLQRFLITRHHRESKRAANEVALEGVEIPHGEKLRTRYERQIAASTESPDVIFDRQWCAELLRQVLTRLGAEYRSQGKEELFKALRPVVLSGGSLRTHDSEALANRLGMTNGALRASLLRLLRDYRTILVEEVRQTVASKEDVDSEIAELMRLVAQS